MVDLRTIVEHETLTEKKKQLRAEIENAIDRFEKENGIYVTNIDYTKNQQMLGCKIDLNLALPKGIR